MLDLILKDSSDYGDEYLSENISRELIDCLKLILKQGDLLPSSSEVHEKTLWILCLHDCVMLFSESFDDYHHKKVLM